MKNIRKREKEIDSTKHSEWVDWQRKEEVTLEEVLCAKDMSHLTHEQAKEVTLFVKTVGGLLYNLMAKENKEDSNIIDLHNNNRNKEAA